MYCHDILALDAIVHSASLSLCLDSSSSSSQTHTTHSMSVDAPFLKVLKFARVCNGMRETTAKPVSYRGMYETYASTARVNLITALSIHPRSSSPSPTRIIIILIRISFFFFFFVLHPLPWCRGPRRPLPTFVIPIRPGCACQGGGTAATGK